MRVTRSVIGRSPNGPNRVTPSPRAGWAVRAGPSSCTPSPTPSHPIPPSSSHMDTHWPDVPAVSPHSSHRPCPAVPHPTATQLTSLTSPSPPPHHRQQQQQQQPSPRQVVTSGRWPERLELRGTSPLMSTNGTPPSRPPSSASTGSSSNIPRVHGHDHTRPLPPPRLPDQQQVSTIPLPLPLSAPLTAPLPPLSASSSFRSRVPLTTDTIPSRSDRQVGEVTLTVPRPDGDRAVNEYVETPFRQPAPTIPNPKCQKNERRHHHQPHHHKNEARTARRHQQTLLQSSPSAPVTKQPVSFTKEPASIGTNPIGLRPNDPSLSIMCDYCGKCRCESCREPPPLPSRWLCDNTCFCSADTALDYASCLCCVKGLFYHCGDSGSGSDSEAGGSCADEPCSCTGSRKGPRWACLAALTMVLPCLLCYWPLKGCLTICETCYARHAAQGCRCDPNARHGSDIAVTRDSRDPEKRLLDPVTPEL